MSKTVERYIELERLVEDAYRFLEDGASEPLVKAKMREQSLVTWLKVAANNLRSVEAREQELRTALHEIGELARVAHLPALHERAIAALKGTR